MSRPTGILVLSVVHFLVGGILLFMVLALTSYSLFLDPYLSSGNENVSLDVLPSGFGMALNLLILLLISVVTIITGIGLLNGWPWIWYVEVLLTISLLLNVIFLSVTTLTSAILIVVPVLLLYYLNRPHVKEFFFGSEDYGESEDLVY